MKSLEQNKAFPTFTRVAAQSVITVSHELHGQWTECIEGLYSGLEYVYHTSAFLCWHLVLI